MNYPGRVVKIGETDSVLVDHLIAGLSAKGYSTTLVPGVFNQRLKSLIQLFQDQNVDALSRPLTVDGIVGPMTWDAIFGIGADNVVLATGLGGAALAIAIGELGVLEDPVGSNRGQKVDSYQIAAGLSLPPGYFWCMAFVYWCFKKAAANSGVDNPFPKSAGCLSVWNKVRTSQPHRIITKAEAIANPALVKPGHVFILDHGAGLGHTGFVLATAGGALRTIEGNTNPDGSSNGIGVFELNRRKIMDSKLKGFIAFD